MPNFTRKPPTTDFRAKPDEEYNPPVGSSIGANFTPKPPSTDFNRGGDEPVSDTQYVTGRGFASSEIPDNHYIWHGEKFISVNGINSEVHGSHLVKNFETKVHNATIGNQLLIGSHKVFNSDRYIINVGGGDHLAVPPTHNVFNKNRYILNATLGETTQFGVSYVWNKDQFVYVAQFDSSAIGSSKVFNELSIVNPPSIGDTLKFGSALVRNNDRVLTSVTVGNTLQVSTGHVLKNLDRQISPSGNLHTGFGAHYVGLYENYVIPIGIDGSEFGETDVFNYEQEVFTAGIGDISEFGSAFIENLDKEIYPPTIGDTSEFGSTYVEGFIRHLEPTGFSQLAFGNTNLTNIQHLIKPSSIQTVNFGGVKRISNWEQIVDGATCGSSEGHSNGASLRNFDQDIFGAGAGDTSKLSPSVFEVQHGNREITAEGFNATRFGTQFVYTTKVITCNGLDATIFGSNYADNENRELPNVSIGDTALSDSGHIFENQHRELFVPTVSNAYVSPLASIMVLPMLRTLGFRHTEFGLTNIEHENKLITLSGSDYQEFGAVDVFNRTIFVKNATVAKLKNAPIIPPVIGQPVISDEEYIEEWLDEPMLDMNGFPIINGWKDLCVEELNLEISLHDNYITNAMFDGESSLYSNKAFVTNFDRDVYQKPYEATLYGKPKVELFIRTLNQKGVLATLFGEQSISNFDREVKPKGFDNLSTGVYTNSEEYNLGTKVLRDVDIYFTENGNFGGLKVRNLRVSGIDSLVTSEKHKVWNWVHIIKPDGNSDAFRKGKAPLCLIEN